MSIDERGKNDYILLISVSERSTFRSQLLILEQKSKCQETLNIKAKKVSKYQNWDHVDNSVVTSAYDLSFESVCDIQSYDNSIVTLAYDGKRFDQK